MRRGLPFVAALVALTLASCGAPRRDAARPTPRASPGTLTLRFEDDLRWPVRVASVRFAADGAVVQPNHALGAVPGLHLAVVRADVRWTCTAAGDEATARVTDIVPIDLGPGGAELRWSLVPRGTLLDQPEARFGVERRLAGDARLAEPRAANDRPLALERCGASRDLKATTCRVGVLVEAARARRDVVDVICKTEKLRELWGMAEATDVEAERRAARIEEEAGQCVGEDLVLQGPVVQVVVPCVEVE